jgi:flagellar biosynthesis chaperone FliJ
MKRYRFRLDQVSRVRRLQEESARADMLLARQRLIDAGADLSMASERLDQRSLSQSQNAHLFRAERHHDELLTLAVTAARAAEANARLLVGRRAEEWTAAAREVSAIDRLEARARAAHDAETERENQKVLDDLVTSRMAARHNSEGPRS